MKIPEEWIHAKPNEGNLLKICLYPKLSHECKFVPRNIFCFLFPNMRVI